MRKDKQDQLLVNLTESRKKMGNKDVQMVLHLTGSKNFVLRWLYAPTSLTIVTLVRSIGKICRTNKIESIETNRIVFRRRSAFIRDQY